ncbi:MAG: calcium/sodium antiporter [Planctomycetota bacterium]
MSEPLNTILGHPFGAAAVLAVGIIVLLLGGQGLVTGSVTVARRLGVSTLVVGLTIVAMGTSAPELAFNLIAAASGKPALSFGNIIGSNIANIGLILGLAALYKPLTVDGRVVKKELPLLLVVSMGMFALAWFPIGDPEPGPAFGRYDGWIMLVCFALFFAGWFRTGLREATDPLMRELGAEAEAETLGSLPWAVFLVLIGLVCLVCGGELTKLGAVTIAEMLGLSEALIGLTIVAFATSLPELVTAIIACRKGHDDLAVGNVVGSNVFNLLLVMGVTAVVARVVLPQHWLNLKGQGWQDLIVMLGITILLMLMAFSHRKIARWEGAVLLGMYLGYMAWGVYREVGQI